MGTAEQQQPGGQQQQLRRRSLAPKKAADDGKPDYSHIRPESGSSSSSSTDTGRTDAKLAIKISSSPFTRQRIQI